MHEIQTFETEDFGAIRVVVIDNTPWFVGKDVALALGYTNPQKAVRDHIDDEDRTVNDSFTVNGTAPALINESGLYSLIMSSKLEAAKQFKRWVTSEVLPLIRKTGFYSLCGTDEDGVLPMRILTPEDYLAAARLIANCKSDRLKIVLHLLAKGGWDIGHVSETPICTDDISERLQRAMTEHSLSVAELAEAVGLKTEVCRAYLTKRRYPRQERYENILAALSLL